MSRRRSTSDPPTAVAQNFLLGSLSTSLGFSSALPSLRPRRRTLQIFLLRPEDLLVLEVSAVGLDPAIGDDGLPRLVRREGVPATRLIIGFPPQHVAEQVFQENDPGNPTLPAGSRFAGPSRLVFEVSAGEEIELTVEGILAAMSRLALVVVPLAAPRRVWFAWLAQNQIAAGTAPMPVPAIPLLPREGATGGALATERLRATRVLAAAGLGASARSLNPDARVAALELPATDRPAAFAALKAELNAGRIDITQFLRKPDPRPPAADETAIEIPSRLQLSPSVQGGWAHAVSVAQCGSACKFDPTGMSVYPADSARIFHSEGGPHRRPTVTPPR